MSTGLLALLDDVAAIAKAAAASIDDVAGQAAKAGTKAAGVVIDDTAVAPGYVVGFSPAREIPIIQRIAIGSLRNKIVFLLPAAILLGIVAPWAITPILMVGGVYLCYEGAEKVLEALFPYAVHKHEAAADPVTVNEGEFEELQVSGAIKTDFILSAEIMAITLAGISAQSIWEQAVILAVVGIGITLAVYFVVALIVKADDLGLILANSGSSASRLAGLALVHGTPKLLNMLGVIGTAAMLWVGGGIVIHGFHEMHIGGPAQMLHDAGHLMAWAGYAGVWLVQAAAAGLAGLTLGILVIPLVSRMILPAFGVAADLVRRSRRPDARRQDFQ